ncbi:unnamed protein product [Prunus armeniaca]
MPERKSEYESEPAAFFGESSDDKRGIDNGVLEIDSVISEGTDDERPELENVDDRDLRVSLIDQENLKKAVGALSLAIVPCGVGCASTSQYCECLMRDTRVPDLHVSHH